MYSIHVPAGIRRRVDGPVNTPQYMCATVSPLELKYFVVRYILSRRK